MGKLRDNSQRARNAIILIWIILCLDFLLIISGYMQYSMLKNFKITGDISLDAAKRNDVREQLLNIIYFVFFVFSAIIFIQWFRRAYYNLHTKVRPLSQTEGWAAGAWFVPIISFYMPYQIMKELYVETGYLLSKNEIKSQQTLSVKLIGWWWALWIFSNVFSQTIMRFEHKAEGIDELINITILSMIDNVIAIPLALITIKVIENYSKVEHLLNKVD